MSISRQDRSSPLIKHLAEADLSARERAAAELFADGRTRAESSLREWLRDPDLLACFRSDRSGFPGVTVGVAVQPATFAQIRSANGMPRLADVPPDFDAIEFELEFAEGIRLDVLTTRDPRGQGAIARFLEKFGENIQQVELDVRNLDRAAELLQSRFGLSPIYPAARFGAGHSRVNFFLVTAKDSGKLLIELVESQS